jgi:cytoskeletal protein CcmA (bactofilin family)
MIARAPLAGGTGNQNHASQDSRADKSGMSVIGADIVVTGNIEASVDLQIEGRVVGDVRCATLILGESSSIVGTVMAERVRVSGAIEGAIDAKDLAVEATARVKGEITYERLKVANGGSLEGQISRRVGVEPAAPSAPLKLVDGDEAAEPARVHYIE